MREKTEGGMMGQDDNNDTQTQANPTVTPTAPAPGSDQDTGAPEVNVDIPSDSAAPATPVSDDQTNTDDTPADSPAIPTDTSSTSPSEPVDSSSASDSTGALMEIKRSALQELSPLLDELSQPPEEKFRTTMMMIQAFDNQKLIGKAYDAAKQIKDRKERAEALLDIVNEINYFTQNSTDKEED